jgi:hypothetical protein
MPTFLLFRVGSNRKSKQSKNGNHIIFIQYCYASVKRVVISTGISIPDSYWDKNTSCILQSIPLEYGSAETLQGILSKQQIKAEKIIRYAITRSHPVSSHTARRSFCTNEYLSGTPRDLITMISGHKTEKAFRKYIKADSLKKASMIKELWNNKPDL